MPVKQSFQPDVTFSLPEDGGIFQGNRKSPIFHPRHCRYYGCKNCTAVFQSKEEAINAGYRPCKQCKL